MWRLLWNILLILAVSSSSNARKKSRKETPHIITVDSSGALSVKAREGRENRDLLLFAKNISSIGPDAFDNLTAVTSFILRPRKVDSERRWECDPKTIDVTPQSFNGLPSIEYIFIVCVNFLNEFNSSKSFGSLKFLMFDNNQLTEIPQEFCIDSPKLEYLIVRYQHIQYLTSASFSKMNTEVLRELLLEFNGLEFVLPRTFARFHHLELLDLSDNKLEILRRGVFDGLGELQKLWVVNNSLRAVERGVFSGLNNLRLLDLRDNKLTTLPSGIFDDLERLERLDLFGNPITIVSDNLLRATQKITHLSLSFNEGIQIDPNAFQGLNLKVFSLSDDGLNGLDAGVFSGLTTELFELRRNSTLNFKSNLFENLTISRAFIIYEPQHTVVDRKSWGLNEKVILRSNPLYMFQEVKTHLY